MPPLENTRTIAMGGDPTIEVTGSYYAGISDSKSTLVVATTTGDLLFDVVLKDGFNVYLCRLHGWGKTDCIHLRVLYMLNLDGGYFPNDNDGRRSKPEAKWLVNCRGEQVKAAFVKIVGANSYQVLLAETPGSYYEIGIISEYDGIGVVSKMIDGWFGAVTDEMARDPLLCECKSDMHKTPNLQHEVARAFPEARITVRKNYWSLYFHGKCSYCRLAETMMSSTIPEV